MKDVAGSNTSVYMGLFTADYSSMHFKDPESMPKYAAMGVSGSMGPGRLSKFFDLRGPSIMADTACSSSLVALDQACVGLREGKAEMASNSQMNCCRLSSDKLNSLLLRVVIFCTRRT